MSITSRILFFFTLAAAAAFYFLLDPMIERVERQYLEAAEEPMVDFANVIAELAALAMREDGAVAPELDTAFTAAKARDLNARIYNFIKEKVELDAYLTDAKGVVIWDSRRPSAVGKDYSYYYDVIYSLRGLYGARSTRLDDDDPRSSIMYVGAPVRKNGKVVGAVAVVKPQKSMRSFIAETRSLFKYWGALALSGFLAAALLLSRWITRPLRRLTDYAQAVARGDRPPPPRLQTPDARTLGKAFEEMRDALEDRKYVESYVQALTHELKSPVAAIRGAAELLQENPPEPEQRKFLNNIRNETVRIEGLADRMLQLSAVERMKALPCRERIDTAELTERICAQHRAAAHAKNVQLIATAGARREAEGDQGLLEIAVSNLIQNAIDFAPGGTEVRVTTQEKEAFVVFRVEDQGPGIPGFAQAKVFERFYSLPRPGTGRKSSGLGLCFVHEVALLHRGEIILRNREDGTKGTVASLQIPGANSEG